MRQFCSIVDEMLAAVYWQICHYGTVFISSANMVRFHFGDKEKYSELETGPSRLLTFELLNENNDMWLETGVFFTFKHAFHSRLSEGNFNRKIAYLRVNQGKQYSVTILILGAQTYLYVIELHWKC